MKVMWDEKKLIKLIEEHGGGGGSITPEKLVEILKGTDYISVDISEDGKSVNVEFDFTDVENFNKELGLKQFIIEANVDMSSDPLNPEIEITSDNIFDELKAYIIAHHKMPLITIKYTIGEDVYYSFVKTFRISYSYGNIDGFILYTDWSEITGIGTEDRQSVMLKVEINDDEYQGGTAKIRFPQHLYEHTIKILSRTMTNHQFEIYFKHSNSNNNGINNLTKLLALFSSVSLISLECGVYAVNIDGTYKEVIPLNIIQSSYQQLEIQYKYWDNENSRWETGSSEVLTDENVLISDDYITQVF